MRARRSIAVILLALAATPLHARYAEPEGPVWGQIDLRASLADGEAGWRGGGFGKALHGSDGGSSARFRMAEATLLVAPAIGWTLKPHLHLQAAPYQDEAIDVVEAYLRWKPVPRSATRFEARAGVFFPPVSLEHDGPAWSLTRTITPSAANSWIGEEVLLLGLEGNVTRDIGDSRVTLTLAGFTSNDTSGTLLSYRGWALHDAKATLFGTLALPEGPTGWSMLFWNQAPRTQPFREIDGRVGFYAKAAIESGGSGFELFAYDNRGDARASEEGQYSWATRFLNAGAWTRLGPDTELLAQGMIGETIAGDYLPGRALADVDFGAAYVLVSHASGPSRLSGRLDYFEARDRSFPIDDNNEHGWAATLAYACELDGGFSLAAEAVRIESDRPSRAVQGIGAEQTDFIAQLSLRARFGD